MNKLFLCLQYQVRSVTGNSVLNDLQLYAGVNGMSNLVVGLGVEG